MNARIKNILLIVLLLLNIGFIGVWWMTHMHGHHKHMMSDHFSLADDKGMSFLDHELGFTDDQKAKIKALWKDHMATMSALQARISVLEKENLTSVTTDAFDSTKAFARIDSAGIIRNEMHKELLRQLARTRQLCNADQKKKFDEIVKNMTMKLQHHWGGHGDTMKRDSL